MYFSFVIGNMSTCPYAMAIFLMIKCVSPNKLWKITEMYYESL